MHSSLMFDRLEREKKENKKTDEYFCVHRVVKREVKTYNKLLHVRSMNP